MQAGGQVERNFALNKESAMGYHITGSKTRSEMLVCYLEINVPARRSYPSDFYEEKPR